MLKRVRRRARAAARAAPIGGNALRRHNSTRRRSRTRETSPPAVGEDAFSPARPFPGDSLSRTTPHWRGESAPRAPLTSWLLGASSGSQTSYHFCAACWSLGTPRGGWRTVPIRRPSWLPRALPSRAMRTAISRPVRSPNRGRSTSGYQLAGDDRKETQHETRRNTNQRPHDQHHEPRRMRQRHRRHHRGFLWMVGNVAIEQ